MSISAVGGQQAQSIQSRLLSDLEKNGLSAEAATTVSADIDTAVKSVTGSSSGKPDVASVRQAIDAKLADDVKSGTITQDEADKVTATLNQFEAQMKQGASASRGAPPSGGGGGAPPAGGGGGGGGGGGSSGSSTEVTDVTTSTSSSGVVTKTTTYADGHKSVTTSVDPSAKAASGSKQSQSASNQSTLETLQTLLKSSTQDSKTSDYLTKLLTSGLIDTSA
jgi:hypothetical protein